MAGMRDDLTCQDASTCCMTPLMQVRKGIWLIVLLACWANQHLPHHLTLPSPSSQQSTAQLLGKSVAGSCHTPAQSLHWSRQTRSMSSTETHWGRVLEDSVPLAMCWLESPEQMAAIAKSCSNPHSTQAASDAACSLL